ncbi:hypothetical protein OIU78_026962 [Salix suchowensis]|nr:hypothetical protein OIU78_026962 [Salix suchowensis]
MNNRVAMHQACASCKHQRKRCGEDCVLAPYFPAERMQEFQAVHKVFGVSNVIKLVKDVNKERQKETAESLVWEATCRRNDPVLGLLWKIQEITGRIRAVQDAAAIAKPEHAEAAAAAKGGGCSVQQTASSGACMEWCRWDR